MDTSTTRPLRADAERNRRLILDAAGAVFAERGLEAGFDEIARSAGVGVGTVYRRFPDRDDLIDALFSERMDTMVGLVEQAMAVEDPWAGLVWFLEQSVAAQSADRGLREVLADGHRGHARLDTARDRMKPAVTALVDRARAAGKLRPEVGALDIAMLSAMLCALSTPESPALWRRYLPLVLEGLAAGDRAPLPHPAPTEQDLARISSGPRRTPA